MRRGGTGIDRMMRRRCLAGAITLAVLIGVAAVSGPTPATAVDATPSRRITVSGIPAGDERFVEALYKDLLGRRSDAAGRAYWVSQMAGGNTRSRVTVRMAGSSEWRGRVVDRSYASILGRPATAAERASAMAQLQRKVRVADVAAGLFATSELWTRTGSTAAGFIKAVYLATTRRAATATELAAGSSQIATADARRAYARARFLAIEANGTRVDDAFGLLLVRTPDAGGRAYWAEQLVRRDDIWMTAAIVAAPEYYDRAQKRVITGSYEQPATTKTVAPETVVSLSGGGPAAGSLVLAAGATPVVGDVVVVGSGASAPDGLMAKVTGRSTDGSGRVVLKTTPARWDEAYPDLSLKGILDVPIAVTSPSGRAAAGAATAASSTGIDIPGCDPAIGGPLTTGFGLSLAASMALDVEFSWGIIRPEVARAVLLASVGWQTQLRSPTVDCEGTVVLGRGGDVGIPGLPSFGPDAGVALRVDALINNLVEKTVTRSISCAVGGEIRGGTFTDLSRCTTSGGASVTRAPLQGHYELGVSLVAGLEMAGVAGMDAEIGTSARLDVDRCASPWWTLTGQNVARATIDFGRWVSWAGLGPREVDEGGSPVVLLQASGGSGETCATKGWTGVLRVVGEEVYVYDTNWARYGLPGTTTTLVTTGTAEWRWGPADSSGYQDVSITEDNRSTQPIACSAGSGYAKVNRTLTIVGTAQTRVRGAAYWTDAPAPSERRGWNHNLLQSTPGALQTETVCGTVRNYNGPAGISRGFIPADVMDDVTRGNGREIAFTKATGLCGISHLDCEWDTTLTMRVTDLPDADADGIPDTKDPTPTVFTPLA